MPPPTLNVDRQANRAAPVVVGIEEGRPGVALMDRLAGSRDRVLVLGVDNYLDDVALLIEEHEGGSDRPPPTADFKGRDARRASPGSRRDAPSRPPTVGCVRSPVARSVPLRRSRRSARNRLDRWPVRARPPAA